MGRSKKILSLGLGLLLLAGCSRQPVRHVTIQSSLTYDPADPQSLRAVSTNVFLGRVLSIDKMDTAANDPASPYKDDLRPQTYGKLELLQDVMGKMPAKADFVRLGGVMMEKDIYSHENKENLKKLDAKRKIAGLPPAEKSGQRLDMRTEGDIYLQPGQTYLLYAKWNAAWQKYELLGFQYGAIKK